MIRDIKKIVQQGYARIANEGCGCNCQNKQIAKSIGYSEKDTNSISEANLGLGCGNPVALANIQSGDVVLDLGSGAGFDVFLAASKVGVEGKVIGVDMTPEMIDRAQANAKKNNITNVEFRLGEIESLPVEDSSINIIISNCVINLSADKLKVFKEAKRVLHANGKMYVSDIVLLSPLADSQKSNNELLVGCVGGAVLKNEYLDIIKESGLQYKILSEDKEISKRQYQGIDLESLKLEVYN
jgi:arsenite methyltransferase